MSTYRLASAEYRGEAHEGSDMEIDEKSRTLEVTYMKGIVGRKTRTRLVKMVWDASTPITVTGARVQVGELTVVAEAEVDAKEIGRLLRMPAAAVVAQRAKTVFDAEEAVREFLKSREESLVLLAKLREDPRGVISQFEFKDEGRDPVDEAMVAYSKRLAEPFKRMTSSLDRLEAADQKESSERLYALAYALGSLQDSVFSGKPVTEAESVFLADLGILLPQQGLKLGNISETLMATRAPGPSAE